MIDIMHLICLDLLELLNRVDWELIPEANFNSLDESDSVNKDGVYVDIGLWIMEVQKYWIMEILKFHID